MPGRLEGEDVLGDPVGGSRWSAVEEPTSAASFPRAVPFDRDYWLMRCDGYSVHVNGARAGVVRGARYGRRLDRPDYLEVSKGRLLRHVVLVSVDEVEEVDPAARVLRVRSLMDAGRS